MVEKFTSGPWGAVNSEPPGQIVLFSKTATGPGKRQARDVGRLILKNEADLKLIVAAPELYLACKEALALFESDEGISAVLLKALNSAGYDH